MSEAPLNSTAPIKTQPATKPQERRRMNPISVFEHGTLPELTGAEKDALVRLNGSLGFEVCKVGWNDVRATSYVGIVQLPTRIIQILPKIYRHAERGEEEATSNLLFLLHYTQQLEISETEIASLMEQKALLSEVLYWVFARRLWDAVRREVLRGYVPCEESLNVFRGRWLIAQQLRRSDSWRRDKFEVAYEEFTEDNLPNRLLKAAAQQVAGWTRSAQTQQYLNQIRGVFDEVADILPKIEDFPRADQWISQYRRRSGQGTVYRPLLNLARLFLLGATTRLSQGNCQSFAYVFDMNVLFEEFIAEFIRREMSDIWTAQGWRMHPQSSTRALLHDGLAKELFWLKPDVRFESSTKKTELILDTKYKILDPQVAKMGVSEADAYQMFAYAKRYECERVILLYPEAGVKASKRLRSDISGPAWLQIQTVNLHRDLSQKAQRDELRADLEQILTKE